MSTRKTVSDEKQKQDEVKAELFTFYANKYKAPVLSLQTQCAQLIPNVVDGLITDCVNLHTELDEVNLKNTKLEGELAALKAVRNSDKKDDKPK